MIDKMITKSTIKKMGFSEKMIKELLPEPVKKINPHFKKSAPMLLWNENDVKAVMELDSFKDNFDKYQKRRKAVTKSIEIRREKTIDEINQIAHSLKVKIIPDDILLKLTIKDKIQFADKNGFSFCFDVNEDTMHRWIVNYIRHNLIDYDKTLELLYKRIGHNEAYHALKNIVLTKISESYPKYADECKRQMKNN